MVEFAVPQWFDEVVYYTNKLAALGEGWNEELLNNAFSSSSYSLSVAGLFQHFLDYGNNEQVSPSPYFDTDLYLRNKTVQFYQRENPTEEQIQTVAFLIQEAGMTFWDHYQRYGWKEAVNPSDQFDTAQYLNDKLLQLGDSWTMEGLVQALEEAQLSPIAHYLAYGRNEGLKAKSVFDSEPVNPQSLASAGYAEDGGANAASDPIELVGFISPEADPVPFDA